LLLSPRVGYRSKKAPAPQHLLAGVVQNCSRAVLRILIYIHPGSKISNKRGAKKKIVIFVFCSHKYHKIENYFIFELAKKNLVQLTKNYKNFPPKIVIKLSKYGFRSGFRDPGSEKKPIFGFRIPGSKRHRIPDPQHCSPWLEYVERYLHT